MPSHARLGPVAQHRTRPSTRSSADGCNVTPPFASTLHRGRGLARQRLRSELGGRTGRSNVVFATGDFPYKWSWGLAGAPRSVAVAPAPAGAGARGARAAAGASEFVRQSWPSRAHGPGCGLVTPFWGSEDAQQTRNASAKTGAERRTMERMRLSHDADCAPARLEGASVFDSNGRVETLACASLGEPPWPAHR